MCTINETHTKCSQTSVPCTLMTGRGHCGHDRMVVGFTTNSVISAITMKVVSSNPAH